MNHKNDPVFPPHAADIQARLLDPNFIEKFDAWTCDEAAQYLTGISADAFTQADADAFEFMSQVLERAMIAGSVPHYEYHNDRFLIPTEVTAWVLEKGFKLPEHVLRWYEEQTGESLPPKAEEEQLAPERRQTDTNNANSAALAKARELAMPDKHPVDFIESQAKPLLAKTKDELTIDDRAVLHQCRFMVERETKRLQAEKPNKWKKGKLVRLHELNVKVSKQLGINTR